MNENKKKICVIGCGIAGLTTSLYLIKEGYDVICLDSNIEEGNETSLLNGSIICPSLTLPWANTTTITFVIESIINSSSLKILSFLYSSLSPPSISSFTKFFKKDTDNNNINNNNNNNINDNDKVIEKVKENYPTRYNTTEIEWNKLWNDPYFWCWLIDFISSSLSKTKYQQSYNASYQLSLFSKKCYLELANEINYQPGIAIGSLQLFSDNSKREKQFNSEKPILGCESLSKDELNKIEPTLPRGKGGAIRNTIDSSGDIKKYCQALKKKGEELGVKYYMNTKVLTWKLDTTNKKKKMKSLFITSTSQSSHVTTIEADYYIFATGNEMNHVTLDLDDIQISWPMKGFAIEAPISCTLENSLHRVEHILADDVKKVYISPLTTNSVRISGVVDIPSRKYNKNVTDITNSYKKFPSIKPMTNENIHRSLLLLSSAMDVLPPNYLISNPYDEKYKYYCCYRPQTYDDLPVIGKSINFSNVYYNGGHGHLGFTRATGTSKLLVELFKNNLQNENNENNTKYNVYIPQTDESKHLEQVNIDLFSPQRCNSYLLKGWRKLCRFIF